MTNQIKKLMVMMILSLHIIRLSKLIANLLINNFNQFNKILEAILNFKRLDGRKRIKYLITGNL